MFMKIREYLIRHRLRSRIWAMRVKTPTWYGDVRYNEALKDCIKLLDKVSNDG